MVCDCVWWSVWWFVWCSVMLCMMVSIVLCVIMCMLLCVMVCMVVWVIVCVLVLVVVWCRRCWGWWLGGMIDLWSSVGFDFRQTDRRTNGHLWFLSRCRDWKPGYLRSLAIMGGRVIVQDQNIKFKILWSQGWVKSFKTNDKTHSKCNKYTFKSSILWLKLKIFL